MQVDNIVITVDDISERKQAEKKAAQLKQVYKNLVNINKTILHATDEDELLKLICRIPVETGLMNMAWVGIENHDTQRIMPLFKFGQCLDYLDQIIISTSAEVPEGLGPAGTAWREQKPAINNDTWSNAAMAPWRNHAMKYGWNAIASFPVFRHGNIYAVFTVYNVETGFFTDEVTALLNTLANDVSYALDALDAKRALKDSEKHARLLLESANSGIWGLDTHGNTTFVNPVAARMLGYSVEELTGKPMHAMVHHSHVNGSPYPKAECPMYATFNDGQPRNVSDEVLWRKDGSCFRVEYTTHPIVKEGVLMGAVVVLQDITKRLEADERLMISDFALKAISQGIVITGTDLCISWVNDAYEEITGYSKLDIMGENCLLQGPLSDPFTVHSICGALENKVEFLAWFKKGSFGVTKTIEDLPSFL